MAALVDATAAVFADWKLTPTALLELLVNRVAPEIYTDHRVADGGLLVWTEDERRRVIRRERLTEVEAQSRDAVVGAFARVLPAGWCVVAARPLSKAHPDFDLYLALGPAVAPRFLAALGVRARRVLLRLPRAARAKEAAMGMRKRTTDAPAERRACIEGVAVQSTNPPAGARRVDALQARFGWLPPEYREFLLELNGGKPAAPRFRVGNGWSRIHYFYGLGTGFAYSDIEDGLVTFAGRIPERMIPVAADPGGNQLLLSLAGEDRGVVYFWDHEEEYRNEDEPERMLNVRRVAGSFADLVRGLTPAPDAMAAPADGRAVQRREPTSKRGPAAGRKRSAREAAPSARESPRARGGARGQAKLAGAQRQPKRGGAK